MNEKREKPYWEGKHYSFFQNAECEYFPCHRIADPSRFNCLFCYCPLYMLGPRCGGNFTYNEKGIKVCTDCVIPHLPENYGRITEKYAEIAAVMRQTLPAPALDQPLMETAASAAGKRIKSCGSRSCGKRVSSEEIKTGRKRGEQNESQSPDCRETGRPFGKIVMMACTRRGFETMRRAAEALADLLPESEILQTGRCVDVAGYEDGPKLSEVTAKWFGEADALIFFASTGIAVRCIAPFARDKFRDPAVLVSDENGRFIISLMSGHVGGGNRLSLVLAEAIGGQPVITTATDGRGLFAVDVFAAENGLQISDRTVAKMISARILAGEIPKIYFDKEYDGAVDDCGQEGVFLNKGIRAIPAAEEETNKCIRGIPAAEEETNRCIRGISAAEEETNRCIRGIHAAEKEISRYGEGIQRTSDRSEADIVVSWRRCQQDRERTLYLIPRAVTLGIGCRRGTAEEAVQKAVRQILADAGVFPQAIIGIASIDLKKGEQGLLAFAENRGLPVTFFAAEELNAVPGSFTSSDFVRNVTGVDCVCERSALRLASDYAAAGDRNMPVDGDRAVLLVKKQSLEGVTASLALRLS